MELVTNSKRFILTVFLLFLLSCAKSSPEIVSQCGDGLLQGLESCDDGPKNGAPCPYGADSCQSCSSECTIVEGTPSYCGDGVIQASEECDEVEPNTSCSYGETFCWVCDLACRNSPGEVRYCGDRIVDATNGEACDAGGEIETCDYGATRCTVCSSSCQLTEIEGTFCGDGVVQVEHEICDDGNTESGDYCRADCNEQTGFCGDGITQNNEVCDDGNTASGDYCRGDCKLVTGSCGDAIEQPNETCDDGNNNNGDYCAADCMSNTGACGDGTLQAGEICDDGNNSYGDYCAADCSSVTGSCGDFLRQSTEICDDGNNDNGDYCSPDCTTVTGACGDSTIQTNETCDDGNTASGDYCSADCQTHTGSCGDNIMQANEACDDGNNLEGDYCAADCMAIVGSCGDDIIQTNEICDDGNNEDNDYCAIDCQNIIGFCGDGQTQSNELCDDGNNLEGDYCSADCKDITGFCGDATTQNNEACDDGNTETGDYCATDCLTVTGSCGDSITQTNENCDDGNDINEDDCLNTCVFASCGDGFIWDGNEDCDTALDHTGMNGTCYSCSFYCTENDSQIFLNHNGDFNDGCEAPTFAQEFGPGDTAISIQRMTIDEGNNVFTAGAFTGLLANQSTESKDGYIQKRSPTGELLWQATLKSSNQMLPESHNFHEEFIDIQSSGDSVIAIAHFCGSDEDDLGLCSASLWEGNNSNHTECINNDTCADGYICDFSHGKCVQKVFTQTSQGKQNGLVLSLNSEGQMEWSVAFLSMNFQPNHPYANSPFSSFDTFTELSALEVDTNGNIYVAGRYDAAMEIKSSTDGSISQKGPFEYCRSDTDCENGNSTCSAPPICGVDCNNDGVTASNECILQAYNWQYGFIAKISSDGEIIYVKDLPHKKMYNGNPSNSYAQNRIRDIALRTSLDGHSLIAIVGSKGTTGSLAYLEVYEEINESPKLLWQTTRTEGNKTQRFERVRFDDEGGLWVTGYSTKWRNSTSFDYPLSFETCSNQTQPTEHILHLDGNDHVALPDNEGLGYEPPFTIAGWFNVNDANNGPQTIWGGGANYLDSHMLYIHARKLRFQRCHSNGNCNVGLSSDENITSQEWVHFAFTVDGESANLYINGFIDKQSTSGSWITSDLSEPIYLGRRSSDSEANFFNGQLDDIGFWNRALTLTEIQALVAHPPIEDELANELLAFYDMSASGNQISSSINHNVMNGTLVGASSAVEEHWCRTPEESCPALYNLSGADSCATAFTCMIECYAGPESELENCRDTCTNNYEDKDDIESDLNWLTYACVETGACDSDPTTYCLNAPCAAEYRRCMNPNKDLSFAAYFNDEGICTFNQPFYEDDGTSDEIASTRIHDLEVIAESAIFSVYEFVEDVHDKEVLTWLSHDSSVEGGNNILWSHDIVSPDQTPINVRDIAFNDNALFWATEYQSQQDMSFVVDFTQDTTAPSLQHTACSTDSCAATGIVTKSLIFTD